MMLASWWSDEYLKNTPVQWLGLLGVLLGAMVVGKISCWILNAQGHRLKKNRHLHLLGVVLHSLSKPMPMLMLAGATYAATMFMNLDFGNEGKSMIPFWRAASKAIAALAITWVLFRLVDIIEFVLEKWTDKTDTALDDQLVPLVRKTLRLFVVVVGLLFVAQNIFHWNIGALVAGLGIGGLAFALAAKDMLANLFGSIMIFTDRPFTMGERIRVKGFDGTVEEVCFRTTKIRTLTGHLVTLPNGIVANEAVENVSRRPFIKHVMEITLTYDTTPERIRLGLAMIQEMFDARSDSFHEDNPPRAYFQNFNDVSLGVVITYWFAPPKWWDFCQFQHEFNIELLERFNNAGLEFAFPTQTLHLFNNSNPSKQEQ